MRCRPETRTGCLTVEQGERVANFPIGGRDRQKDIKSPDGKLSYAIVASEVVGAADAVDASLN